MSDLSEPVNSKSARLLSITCGALPGLFLLSTSTTFLVDGQFVYDIKRILELSLILVLLVVAVLNSGIRKAMALQLARIPGWLAWLLGLIVTLGIISSFVSATSTQLAINSLLEVALLSLLLVAALVIAACRSVAGKLFDQVAITLLAISVIAVGIQELLGVVAALSNEVEFFARISLMHYSWPRFFNQVQAWTLPVLGILPLVWARSHSEMLRSVWFQLIICLLTLTLYWYLILMTGGRGVAISLLLAFVVCLLFLPAIRRTTIRWHLPGLLLGAVLFLGIAQMNQHVQSNRTTDTPPVSAIEQAPAEPGESDYYVQPGEENRFASQSMSGRLSLDSSGRLPMWRDSVGYIREHPVLGIGPMNFACIGPRYRAGHPHNFALQFAAEWGLAATLGLIIIVFYLIRVLWQTLRSKTDKYEIQLASMLTTGLVAAAVYSCLSGVLVMPASQVMGLLIGGWLLGTLPLKKQQPRISSRKAIIILACALAVALPVTVFSISELSLREYRESIIPTLDRGIPRYWQQGKQCKYFESY